MSVLVPDTLHGALEALAADPDAEVLAGGTDVMVEINAGHRHPRSVVAISGIAELAGWQVDPDNGDVVVRAATTYRTLEDHDVGALVPALAQAARTVGSPQIRNAATIGGNLATCSPAGDGLPVLAAFDAIVELASATGRRELSIGEFMVGVKRTALLPSELVVAVRIPRCDGWTGFAKVGIRGAMVISTVSACVAVDRVARSVRIALGSVAPTVIRARDAEEWLDGQIDWSSGALAGDRAATLRSFAEQVRAAARPIDDHRSTAEYRRHAVGVLASRLVARAFPIGGDGS